MTRFALVSAASLLTAFGASTAWGAPVAIANADFEAGSDGLTADSWADTEPGAGSYYYAASEGAYAGGRALSMQGLTATAYTEQVLAGLTSSTYSTYTVNFDAGFRSDSFTGSADIEVSLIVAGSSVGSQTVTVSAASNAANTAAIPFNSESVVINLDMTGLNGSEAVSLRFSNISDGGAQPWSLTALVDNVSVTAVPEPGSLALLGLGGLMIARRRRG